MSAKARHVPPEQDRARYFGRKAAGVCVVGRCRLPCSPIGVTCFGHYLTRRGGLACELRAIEKARTERKEAGLC